MKAIRAMTDDTTKLCAKCAGAVSLKSADPKLADAVQWDTWQVICHGERLPVGHRAIFTQGVMMNCAVIHNRALNNVRVGALLNRIAGLCCFDKRAIGNTLVTYAYVNARYPRAATWGKETWTLARGIHTDAKKYDLDSRYS